MIAAATAIFNFPVHHAWKGALLAFLVALIVSAIAAQSTARRLQGIVRFADRIAAGDLAARIEETSRMKSDRWPPRWTKPPAIWKKALPRCRPASANSNPAQQHAGRRHRRQCR